VKICKEGGSLYRLYRTYKTTSKKRILLNEKRKLNYNDVYSDSDTDLDQIEPNDHLARNGKSGDEGENLIQIGSYVLVRFVSNKSTERVKEYKFIAVCQGPVGEDSEVEVMFMKLIKTSAKGDTFVMDENNTSHINTSQVIKILKQPSIKTCSNRIYYEFTDDLQDD